MYLNDVIVYGVTVPFLAMALCRTVNMCILLVNYGMYILCIVAGVYYCLRPIAWHTVAYFVDVMAVTTLIVGLINFFSAFEKVWDFVLNDYYGGVLPLGHEAGSALVWKCNMYILLFYL